MASKKVLRGGTGPWRTESLGSSAPESVEVTLIRKTLMLDRSSPYGGVASRVETNAAGGVVEVGLLGGW